MFLYFFISNLQGFDQFLRSKLSFKFLHIPIVDHDKIIKLNRWFFLEKEQKSLKFLEQKKIFELEIEMREKINLLPFSVPQFRGKATLFILFISMVNIVHKIFVIFTITMLIPNEAWLYMCVPLLFVFFSIVKSWKLFWNV